MAAELTLYGRPIGTVFDLLGHKENDITYSLGWALAESECLSKALLQDVAPSAEGDLVPETVRLQEGVSGRLHRHRDPRRRRRHSRSHRGQARLPPSPSPHSWRSTRPDRSRNRPLSWSAQRRRRTSSPASFPTRWRRCRRCRCSIALGERSRYWSPLPRPSVAGMQKSAFSETSRAT